MKVWNVREEWSIDVFSVSMECGEKRVVCWCPSFGTRKCGGGLQVLELGSVEEGCMTN